MRYPTREEERMLHEQVLGGSPLAPEAVFMAFMESLSDTVRREMRCDEDFAYDAMVDAVFAYLGRPERYEPEKGRLTTYLLKMAKNRVVDRYRAAEARTQRDQKYARHVELSARNPKEEMEDEVEARLALARLVEKGLLKNERDWAALRLILQGERSTEILAKALGLSELPPEERKKAVKRHRDRLMKLLERRGKKEKPDDES